MKRVRVLYILGTTRSGSTILERVLGTASNVFAGGEVHWMWRTALSGSVCSCGSPIGSCEVWSEVLRRAVGGDADAADAQQVVRWQRAARLRRTFRLLSRSSVRRRDDLGRYVHLLRRVYPAIEEVTGASMVVDSSKSPAVAAILAQLPEIELYLVHLVRDPRAFAYSWRRGKPRDGESLGAYRPGPLRSAARWIATNLLAEVVRRRVPPSRSLLVRYEDLVEHPRAVTASILRFAGIPDPSLPFADDRTVRLEGGHTSSGNRSRFATGEVTIEHDDSWMRAARDPARTLVGMVTAPWLARYGYSLRTDGSAVRGAVDAPVPTVQEAVSAQDVVVDDDREGRVEES